MNRLNHTLLVMRQEIFATTRKLGFMISAFGVPLILGLIAVIIAISNSRSEGEPAGPPAQTAGVQGYVDPGGWIRAIPPELENAYTRLASEATAQTALEAGEIDGYFLVDGNYLETGGLTYITLKFDPVGGNFNLGTFEQILTLNLFGENIALGVTALNPLAGMEVRRLEPPQEGEEAQNWLSQQLPFFLVILLYMVILMPASTLVSSITDEKKNRVLEVLLSSVSPREFFAGKLLALGLIGFAQTLLWVGTVWAVGYFGGSALNLPEGFSIPGHLIFWAVVFSMTGYAMYGTQMAGIGALSPNMNDSRSLTMIVLAPLIVGYFFNIIYLSAPETPILLFLSMFPLTAPVVMVGRMAALDLPVWQPFVSLVLQVLTVYGIFALFSRLFRAQALLSGQPLTLGGLVKALRAG